MQFDRTVQPETPDISVSVVAYQQTPAEMATLLAQLHSTCRMRVVVVDNSETPILQATVEATGAQYLFMGHNAGFGRGHNVALRQMIGRAPYHAVINPDIAADGDVLSELFHFMESHPEVGQVMPNVLNTDGTEQRLAKRLPTPMDLIVRRFLGDLGKRIAPRRWDWYEARDLDLSVPREIPCLSGCFMFLRDSVLQKVGIFDERFFLYMEDFDLCRRIGAVSRTVMLPTVSVVHGHTKGSYRKLRLLGAHVQSAIRYFSKWGWFVDRERDRLNQRVNEVRAVPSRVERSADTIGAVPAR